LERYDHSSFAACTIPARLLLVLLLLLQVHWC
jgi:hypothetical protein